MGLSLSTSEDTDSGIKNLAKVFPVQSSTDPKCNERDDLELGLQPPVISSLFPWMTSETHQEFLEHQRNLLSFRASLPPIIFGYIVFVGTRMNLYRFTTSGPWFLFLGLLCLLGTLLKLLVIAAYCLIRSRSHSRSYQLEQKFAEYADWLLKKSFWGHFEDAQCIFGTIGGCIVLLARVYAGQCPDGCSIWESQGCNPVAQSHSIPHDQVIFNYSIPLMMVTIFKGCSIYAAVLSYLISMTTILIALAHVDGWLQIYSVIYVFLYMYLSFEMECKDRLAFLSSKRELEAVRAAVEKEREMRAAEDKRRISEEKSRQIESEKLLIQSILGNMAHDMKTPIHCIKAELQDMKQDICRMATTEVSLSLAATPEVSNTCQAITSIENITDFMLMSINRCQDYCKLDRGIALVPVLETFDVVEVFTTSIRLIKTISSDRSITFHPLPSDICQFIISDQHWLLENLLCLTSNAMKYSPRGAEVDVRTSLIKAGQKMNQHRTAEPVYPESAPVVRRSSMLSGASTTNAPECQAILFEVEDNGVGISAEMQRNLFQPFQQAQRMAGGTGLGLFSLRQRVEALGGECGVKKRKDGKQGSVFWFTIPYRPDHTQEENTEGAKSILLTTSVINDELKPKREEGEEHKRSFIDERRATVMLPPGGVSMGGSKSEDGRKIFNMRRVLIVDDTQTIMKVVCKALRAGNFIVDSAENGSEALDKLKATFNTADAYDLCITDLQMPVMDGLECVRRYREFERIKQTERIEICEGKASSLKEHKGTEPVRKRLTIIGMSANSTDSLVQEVLDVGMDAFIEKPFTIDVLEQVLANIKTNDRLIPSTTP